jgi:hypothetical protein
MAAREALVMEERTMPHRQDDERLVFDARTPVAPEATVEPGETRAIDEAEVLRLSDTDVMAVVPLVKARLAAPVVGSRRDQTDTSWRSGPAAVGG